MGAGGLDLGHPAGGKQANRFYRWRIKTLARPELRSFFASFWLTGWFVRRQARALFDLVAGFTYSQTLLALVESDIIDRLAKSPCSKADLEGASGLNKHATDFLIDAGIAIGVLSRINSIKERRSGADALIGLSLKGAALAGDPGISAMVRHHKLLYRDLVDPLDLLRSDTPKTELNAFYKYSGNRDSGGLKAEDVADYSRLMAVSQRMVSSEIIAAHSFVNYHHMLDIGGGEGRFAKQVIKISPDTRISIFDLPSVSAATEQLFEKIISAGDYDDYEAIQSDQKIQSEPQPQTERSKQQIQFIGGDFLTSAFPADIDAISLVRVLFDHSDDIVSRLLKRCFEALPADGELILAEPMAQTPGAEPVGHAYYGFYLKAMGEGRIRTADHHKALLKQAGFVWIKEVKTAQPIICRLLIARKK